VGAAVSVGTGLDLAANGPGTVVDSAAGVRLHPTMTSKSTTLVLAHTDIRWRCVEVITMASRRPPDVDRPEGLAAVLLTFEAHVTLKLRDADARVRITARRSGSAAVASARRAADVREQSTDLIALRSPNAQGSLGWRAHLWGGDRETSHVARRPALCVSVRRSTPGHWGSATDVRRGAREPHASGRMEPGWCG
jgi:hypothetical protein